MIRFARAERKDAPSSDATAQRTSRARLSHVCVASRRSEAARRKRVDVVVEPMRNPVKATSNRRTGLRFNLATVGEHVRRSDARPA